MWSFMSAGLLCLLGVTFPSSVNASRLRRVENDTSISLSLSSAATISHNVSTVPRWSEFKAPSPGTIVNVATEQDVAVTVKYCIKNNIPFLAQNGGHGWSSTLDLYSNGILINLAGLNKVTFNDESTEVTLQGGALVENVINAAYENNAQVLTGNCNCVGALGAGLGGGYGNLLGLHGFSVDNMLSLNVVLANGDYVTVTPTDKDLWWALRGAGPNFGIVTSAVMKAYPVPQANSTAWTGALFFTEDKIEALVQAIENLDLTGGMNIFMYFLTTGPPSYTPTVLITPFYYGSEADGKAAFQSIYDIEPYLDKTAETIYTEWNAGAANFCEDGGRKPSYSAGFMKMVPSVWREIWNEFITFLKQPGTSSTTILLEVYSLQYAQSIDASTASFSNRYIRFNAAVIPWYNDASLDPVAETFGSSIRDLWRSVDHLPGNRTYVNFAHGDETNANVYSPENVQRLRKIKQCYDPDNVFSHWFNIKP
ncbi:hypothetical protein MFRU_011g02010 [Monilinia fructicola]|nr:hypothetical protein MFRU_011g02010 [Monilinia fructicola]